MVRKKLSKAHKQGGMKKHKVTKNPRWQNKNMKLSKSNNQNEIVPTISKNPSQIQ